MGAINWNWVIVAVIFLASGAGVFAGCNALTNNIEFSKYIALASVGFALGTGAVIQVCISTLADTIVKLSR